MNQVTVARIMMVVVKVGVDGVHCLLFFFFVEHVSNIASLIRQGPCLTLVSGLGNLIIFNMIDFPMQLGKNH